MQALILELSNRIDQVSEEAKSAFASLDKAALNWKSNPKAWSVAQCLDHLMTTNELYLPIFAAVQNDKVPQNIFSKLRFFSGLFGRSLRKQLGAVVDRKSKSPTSFQPSASELAADILDRFLAHQEELKAAMHALPDLDYSNLIIISPAASFVTYSLEDALYIIAGHEERHLNQAKRVTQLAQFPINLRS